MSDGKLAFSIDEVVARTDISRDGIYRAIREKRLDAKKMGRRTIVPAEALRRFIESLPSLDLAVPLVKG